jgi:hypothetical protein
VTAGVRHRSPGPAAPSDLSHLRSRGPGWSPDVRLRPRHRRLLVVLISLAVLGAGLLGLQWSVSRMLLSTDSGPSSFPGAQVQGRVAAGDEIRVAYQHGAPYEFAFTVTNYSRWPVRILDFPAFDDLLSQRAVDLDWTPLAGENWRPFHPFTLGSDDSVLIRIRTEFAHCDRYSTGGSDSVHGVPIRYRTLWLTRTRFLDLPTTINVPAPARGGCPVS